jgi:thiamine-monophosphate kinase
MGEGALTTVGEAGEQALLEEIGAILESSGDASVVLGFGDDGACVAPSKGMELVMSCDVQVEGVHFEPGRYGFQTWGSRLTTAALSDLAAMGARPRWCLISLGLRKDLLLREFRSLYVGIASVARAHGATPVGGNLSSTSSVCFCDLFVVGEVERGGAVSRGTAHPGHRIAVSGYPGRAAAGLALLAYRAPETDAEQLMSDAYLKPHARLTLGGDLARRRLARAMTDISDGLLRDVSNICEASGCGAVVRASCLEDVPLAEVARSLGRRPDEFLFGASDDYELMFTVNPDDWLAVDELVFDRGEGPVRVIGEIREEPGLFLRREDGTMMPVDAGGWDALRHAEGRGSGAAREQGAS